MSQEINSFYIPVQFQFLNIFKLGLLIQSIITNMHWILYFSWQQLFLVEIAKMFQTSIICHKKIPLWISYVQYGIQCKLFRKLHFLILYILNRTHYISVFEHKWYSHEYKVKQEHGETKSSVHLPSEAGNRHDDKNEHHEKNCYRTHHSHWIHFHRLPVDNAVQQPRHW